MITIKTTERKDNKKGPWLVLKYVNDKGEEKTTNVFNQGIIDSYKGPGKYEATWVQDGKYWNLSQLALIALDGGATPTSSSNGHQAAAPAPAPAVNGRATVAVESIKAAAMVYQGAGDKGAESVEVLAGVFMKLCESFITRTKKADKTEPEGA